LALKGFFAQSQTHLIAPASGAAIIFPVPLHPINALAPSMPAHAVGSDLTAADAGQKRDRSRLSKTATHVTGDTRALPVANLRTIDVAELLKFMEGAVRRHRAVLAGGLCLVLIDSPPDVHRVPAASR
jgi:hypothetical protein